MKRNELFNLFEQEYPLECRTFKAFRFSLLLTSVSFIHHRIDIRLHNSTASEEQGLESLADSSAKRDIRSLRVSNEREKERERIESTLPFSELFHFQREFMTILPGSRRRCSSAGFNCAPFSRRILLPADRPSRLV